MLRLLSSACRYSAVGNEIALKMHIGQSGKSYSEYQETKYVLVYKYTNPKKYKLEHTLLNITNIYTKERKNNIRKFKSVRIQCCRKSSDGISALKYEFSSEKNFSFLVNLSKSGIKTETVMAVFALNDGYTNQLSYSFSHFVFSHPLCFIK